MASPSSSLATLRPDLASMIEFDLAMDQNDFIGLKVAPVIEVAKASGNFGKIPLEELLKAQDVARAPGSGYGRDKFTFEPMTYTTTEKGFEQPIDDNERAMHADYFDVEVLATLRAYDAVLRAHEKLVADTIFNTSTWTGSSLATAVGTPWSTHASATPIDDVEAAVLKVYSNSGRWPNSLVLTRKAFRHLRLCSQVTDRIASSGAGSSTRMADITIDHLRMVFDIPNIYVAGGSRNSANEGQSATLTGMWDDTKAMVGYIDQSNDVRRPTIARTFHWSEDGSQIGGAVESYRDETVRSDIVRVRHQVGIKVMYTEMGHLLTSVTA